MAAARRAAALVDDFDNAVAITHSDGCLAHHHHAVMIVLHEFHEARDSIDFVSSLRCVHRLKTRNRPVGVSHDPRDVLIVADDLASIVWRVTPDN
jgi:glucose/arabinose dehydrogenase